MAPASILKASDADLGPSHMATSLVLSSDAPSNPWPLPTFFFFRIFISIGKVVLADQGRGENGHRRTRMTEDGGGAGEAGACLVGCVSGRGTRLWVRGTLHEGWGETREIFRWRGRTWVPLE